MISHSPRAGKPAEPLRAIAQMGLTVLPNVVLGILLLAWTGQVGAITVYSCLLLPLFCLAAAQRWPKRPVLTSFIWQSSAGLLIIPAQILWSRMNPSWTHVITSLAVWTVVTLLAGVGVGLGGWAIGRSETHSGNVLGQRWAGPAQSVAVSAGSSLLVHSRGR